MLASPDTIRSLTGAKRATDEQDEATAQRVLAHASVKQTFVLAENYLLTYPAV